MRWTLMEEHGVRFPLHWRCRIVAKYSWCVNCGTASICNYLPIVEKVEGIRKRKASPC